VWNATSLLYAFVLGKRDRLHIDTGGGIVVYFRVRNRQHLHAGATKFLNLALAGAAVTTEPREIMDDDHREVGGAAGAVDHSMKFVPPRLVAVGTGCLLELSCNLDLVRFRVTADFMGLFGHGEPRSSYCPIHVPLR
jgi:hypothetical protein